MNIALTNYYLLVLSSFLSLTRHTLPVCFIAFPTCVSEYCLSPNRYRAHLILFPLEWIEQQPPLVWIEHQPPLVWIEHFFEGHFDLPGNNICVRLITTMNTTNNALIQKSVQGNFHQGNVAIAMFMHGTLFYMLDKD